MGYKQSFSSYLATLINGNNLDIRDFIFYFLKNRDFKLISKAIIDLFHNKIISNN